MPTPHTPEPWEIEYENDGNGHYREWLRVGPATIDVTRAEGAEPERAYADARLIQAAPLMLDVIKRLVAVIGNMAHTDVNNSHRIAFTEARSLLAGVELK